MDGRSSQLGPQGRGVGSAIAMLLQHLGERRLVNAVAIARRWQAPPQVKRPRRRDIVVGRVEETVPAYPRG